MLCLIHFVPALMVCWCRNLAVDGSYTDRCSFSGVKGEAVHVDTLETYKGSGTVTPPILSLDAGWRRFVSVTPQPLPGENPAVS